MNYSKEYNSQIFESIKYIDEDGKEFWKARELMLALEYTKWSNFKKVVDKAKLTCELSGNTNSDHFADVGQTIKMPKGASKKVVAFGQTYFAVQTRNN